RTHRFVFSAAYSLPSAGEGLLLAVTKGWLLSGVATIQSGSALTITYVNSNNVFGITQDHAQLAAGCGSGQIVTSGSVSSKLSNYFNRSCFTTPPIIGADGVGTAFGDGGTGIVNGPGQFNVDASISKSFSIHWPREAARLQFRAEFFNAFNHPQFDVPDS